MIIIDELEMRLRKKWTPFWKIEICGIGGYTWGRNYSARRYKWRSENEKREFRKKHNDG